MYFGTLYQNYSNIDDQYKKDKLRRMRGMTADKKGATFVEAGRPVQTINPTFQSTSSDKSFKWEHKALWDLPRSYGRSYNAKFNTAMDKIGVPESERGDFRKYLDAKEKKQLQSSYFSNLYDEALGRSIWTKANPKSDKPIVPPAKRSLFNRIVSPLMVGNYASADFADALANHKGFKTAFGDAWKGVQASMPWGDGNPEYAKTYSTVLRDMGVKPDPNGSKFDKSLSEANIGAWGFALDVLLDPTTYLTGGVSALLKGTGTKALTGAVKLLDHSTAKDVIAKQLEKRGKTLSDEELTKQADKLVTEFDKLRGTNRKADNVKVGVKGSLLEPVLKGVGLKKLSQIGMEIPHSGKVLQKIGDATTARAYASLRNTMYGTHLSRLFSTKAESGLVKYAKKDPGKLFDVMQFTEKTLGRAGDKVEADRAIREYAKQTLQLSPADTNELLKTMEDKRLWTTIKRTTGIADMQQAKQLRKDMEAKTAVEASKVKGLLDRKAMLGHVQELKARGVDGAHEVLKTIEDQYAQGLHEIDSMHLNPEDHSKYVNMLNEHSKQLEEKFIGTHSPIKPALQEAGSHGLTEPVKKDIPAPSAPKLDSPPVKPVHGSPPTREQFVNKEQTDLESKGQDLFKWWKGLDKKALSASDKVKMADEMSKLIYGEPGKISKATFPGSYDSLIHQITEKKGSQKWLQEFITHNKHFYDGRGADIYSHLGDVYKYGDSYKYKTWEEFYTKRMAELEPKARIGDLTHTDKMLYDELNTIRNKRAVKLSKLKDMSHAELKKYLKDYRNINYAQDFRDVLNRDSKLGSVEQERRNRFTAEDRSTQARRTGEFDEKVPYEVKLTQNEYDDALAYVLNDLTHGGSKSAPSEKMYHEHLPEAYRTVAELPRIVKEFFNRNYSELSTAQRRYAIGLAKKDAKLRESGKLGTPDPAVTKALKDEATRRAEVQHVDAVHASVEEGSRVAFRKNEKGIRTEGVVRDITTEADGTKTYTVETKKDGTVSLKASDITNVRGKKPAQLILDYTQHNSEKQFQDATAKYEEDKAKLDAEYEAKKQAVESGNAEKLKAHEEELHRVEQERVKNEEEYKKAKEEYDAKVKQHEDITAQTKALNEATHGEWKKAVAESSESAQTYFDTLDSIHEELKSASIDAEKLHADKKKAIDDFTNEYNTYKQKATNDLIEAEKLHQHVSMLLEDVNKTLSSDEVVKIQVNVKKIYNALGDDDAFSTYVETHMPDEVKKWDAQVGNSMHVGKLVLDQSPINKKVKNIAVELRDFFRDVADKEVGIGKLKKQQADAMMMNYLPHVMTDDGAELFRNFKMATDENGDLTLVPRPQKEKADAITGDLGYGQTWNNFGETRQIKSLKLPDGTIVKHPNVQQINEAIKPFLKGKNAFSENVSDLFVARMLKHNELMYDDHYMKTMMDDFGDELADGVYTAEKGTKVVMNYGMFQNTMHELATLHNSLSMGDMVTSHIEDVLLPQTQGMDSNAISHFIQTGVEEFAKTHFTTEFMQKNYDDVLAGSYRVLGLDKETFHSTATPMVELSPSQTQAMKGHYAGTIQDFATRIEKQKKSLQRYAPGDAERLARISKNEDKLANMTKLQIKQVNESIVHKANQACKVSMAKDKSNFLSLYDKFTHFIKLNETTVMPSFHMRNAMSNKYLSWLAVGNDIFDMEMNKLAFTTIKLAGDLSKLKDLPPVVDKAGKVYHWNELYDLAQTHGVIDEGFFAKDIGAGSASKGLFPSLRANIKGKKVSLDPTDTENFALYAKGRDIGSRIENYDRLLQFAVHLKQGKSVMESVDQVNKYLFDYGDITSFEKNVMRRIFPYYTWIKKNGTLQLTDWMEHPGRYRDVQKGLNSIDGGIDPKDRVERQYLAPFARDWKQTPWSYDNGKTKEPILWSPNLPFMDLGRIPDPTDITQTVQDLIPQMNPLLKEPMEQATNHDTFFNAKIASDNESTGKQMADRASHVLSNNALFTAGKGAVTKKGLDLLLHAGNTLAGQKFLSYNYDANKNVTIAKYLGKWKDKETPDIAQQFFTKMDAKEQSLRGIPVHAINAEKDNVARMIDDYIQGKTMDKHTAGKYYPFLKVMKDVGFHPSRKWVTTTLDSTDLDGKLLNSDFTEGTVVKVRDGDTADVKVHGKTYGVRFNLIDTPETVDPRIKVTMPYGHEASNFTKEHLLAGKHVRLVVSKDKDLHGRLVAYVYVDGQDYNKELLKQGLAKLRYKSLSENPFRSKEYMQTQLDANANNKGIWSLNGYANPADDEKGWNMKESALKRYLKQMYGK